MRYITHQFAHLETLERARRWLTQAGIDPSRVEARTHGVLSLSVSLLPGESVEVQRIFDAAESSDPDGYPGIWDVAVQHVAPHADKSTPAPGSVTRSESFVIGWRPQDAEREVTQTDTDLQREYRDGKD